MSTNWKFVSITSNGEQALLSYHFLLNVCESIVSLADIYRLGGEVSKVFPDLLLATMDIIHTQYKNLKGRDGYTFNTDEAKERVRNIIQ